MAKLTCALGPDNAGAMLLAALRGAEKSVEASVYEIGDAYVWAFVEAARRGVVVRMVVDPRSDPEMRNRAMTLGRAGVDCRLLAQPDSLAHAKVVVVDDTRCAVGTGNLNGRNAPFHQEKGVPLAGTREWWVMLDDVPTLTRLARAHVLRNWRAGAPALGLAGSAALAAAPPIHPVKPEYPILEIELAPRRLRLASGGAGVRALEEELLVGTRHRALVTVPYVDVAAPAVAALIGALTAHARRGSDVRLLLGRPPLSKSDLVMLRHIDVPIRVMDSEQVATITTGHAKGIVCDESAVVGSANWSETGLSSNDEAAIAISHPDAAGYYAAAFERDWAPATPMIDRW